MATWASLTPAQQKTVTDFMLYLRPLAGQLAITMNHLNAANVSWNASVSAVVALLTSTEVIGDTTSLIGAQPITAATLTSIVTGTGGIEAILTSSADAAHFQTYSNLCGPGNITG